MSTILGKAVTQGGDLWDFACPVFRGTPRPCGFTSTGWPTRKVAQARGQQHFDEHKGIAVTPSLDEFRAEQGLAPDGITTIRVEDL